MFEGAEQHLATWLAVQYDGPVAGTRAWIGVDLGTSSLKVLAVGEDGVVLDQREKPLPVDRPGPGRAEADPAVWTQAVDEVLAPLGSAYDVRGVGVTGQMHGTVLLDEEDRPVRPAVLWPDTRGAAQRHRWEALPAAALGQLGNPWSPGMTGPVLSWLAENEPHAVTRAARVLLPKDVVRCHLVPGSAVTDPSDASGTLLFDVANGTWLDGLDALVPVRLLPALAESSSTAGTWRDASVCVGGGDTPVSLLTLRHSLGGWQQGDVVVNLGTGAQVIDPVASVPSGEGWPEAHRYADVDGGHYAMVAAQNAGLALDWALGRLGLTWAELARHAQQAPVGAGGVLFRPFLSAERGALRVSCGPGWSIDMPPVGLAARAAAEAQAFLVRRSWDVLGAEAHRVVLVGGGAREAWVRQLLADVLHRPVQHVPMRSASAAGAVLLAGGPLPEGVSAPTGTAEPAPSAQLDDAYARWVELCYGAVGPP